MDRTYHPENGSAPMKKVSPKEVPAEGVAAYPPRFASEAASVEYAPHRIEREVQRALLSHPRLRFSSLVIRRTGNGVCLQGVLQDDADSPDVCTIAQRVAGVEHVLNHLVIAPAAELPRKG